MYDKDSANEIRAIEIVLGNPPNRGVSRPEFSACESKGKPLFVMKIDYHTGDAVLVPTVNE